MIGVEIDKAFVEGVDSRDTRGRMVIVQVGPLIFSFYLGWGRR